MTVNCSLQILLPHSHPRRADTTEIGKPFHQRNRFHCGMANHSFHYIYLLRSWQLRSKSLTRSPSCSTRPTPGYRSSRPRTTTLSRQLWPKDLIADIRLCGVGVQVHPIFLYVWHLYHSCVQCYFQLIYATDGTSNIDLTNSSCRKRTEPSSRELRPWNHDASIGVTWALDAISATP